jgi:hypothetical protein
MDNAHLDLWKEFNAFKEEVKAFMRDADICMAVVRWHPLKVTLRNFLQLQNRNRDGSIQRLGEVCFPNGDHPTQPPVEIVIIVMISRRLQQSFSTICLCWTAAWLSMIYSNRRTDRHVF